MGADRTRSQAFLPSSSTWNLPAPLSLFSSTLSESPTLPPWRALVFHPWLNHILGSSGWLWAGHTIPARMDLELSPGFQQQLSQSSKDQICASERSSLWGQGRRMTVMWVSGGQAHGKGQRTEEEASSWRASEEEEISEIQRRMDGEKGDIGEFRESESRLTSLESTWIIRCQYSVVGQASYSSGAQDPPTTMREFTTQGKKYWDPHPRSVFKRFTCDVTDLICTHEEQRVPQCTQKKSTVDVALNLQLNLKEANGLNNLFLLV